MTPIRESKIHFSFLIITLAMAAAGWYGCRIPDRQADQTRAVARTHGELGVLADLSNHLADAESGQRDFMLTGQLDYLNFYLLAARGANNDIARFQQATRDNLPRQARASALREQIAAGLDALQKGIDDRKFLSQEAAMKGVVSGRDKAPIDLARQQLDQIVGEEQLLLKQRASNADAAAAITRGALLGTGALAFLLLAIVYGISLKEARQKARLRMAEERAANARREETERLTGIAAAQREAAGTPNLQAVMQGLTERAREITHAVGAATELAEGDDRVCHAACGTMALQLNLRLNPAASLTAQSVESDAVLKCDDTETDERVDRTACRKAGVRSMVAVPLRREGRAIGALHVTSAQPNGFTDQDVAALESIGGMLSAAITSSAAAEALRACQHRLAEVHAAADLGSWEFDRATGQSTWSQGLFRLVGMDHEIAEPDYALITALFATEDGTRLSEAVQRALREGVSYSLDLRQTGSDEEMPRSYHASGWPVRDAQGKITGLAGTFADTTDRKHRSREVEEANTWLAEANAWIAEAQPRLVSQAVQIATQSAELAAQETQLRAANTRLDALETTDGLTGLNSHRIFQERLSEERQRAVRYGTSLSVVLLDIDDFKSFNDAFGHPAGDGVLKRIAGILDSTARASDVVARYGGEEFVLLLPETDSRGAVDTAERIRQAVSSETLEQRAITVSVGAATLDSTTATAASLLKAAETALYQSKTQGRNRVTHIDGTPRLSDGATPQAPTLYIRRFSGKLGEDRPSRRLLDKLDKAS